MNKIELDVCEATGNTPTKSAKPTEKDTTEIKTGIYGLRNKITNQWYVGQSASNIKNRWRKYKYLACEKQVKLYNALVKYGINNFEMTVLEYCVPNRELLNEREKHWIAYYDSFNNGYNLTSGGSTQTDVSSETKQKCAIAGKSRKPITIEEKEALRKRRTGIVVSDQTKEKLRVAQLGRKLSEETKTKLRAINNGRKHTPEAREKIRQAIKEWHSKKRA